MQLRTLVYPAGHHGAFLLVRLFPTLTNGTRTATLPTALLPAMMCSAVQLTTSTAEMVTASVADDGRIR